MRLSSFYDFCFVDTLNTLIEMTLHNALFRIKVDDWFWIETSFILRSNSLLKVPVWIGRSEFWSSKKWDLLKASSLRSLIMLWKFNHRSSSSTIRLKLDISIFGCVKATTTIYRSCQTSLSEFSILTRTIPNCFHVQCSWNWRPWSHYRIKRLTFLCLRQGIIDGHNMHLFLANLFVNCSNL